VDLTALQIIALALVVVLSTTIQTAVGFGSGLFMVPIVLWLGLPLPQAVAFTAVATFGPMIATCYQLRRHIRWPPADGGQTRGVPVAAHDRAAQPKLPSQPRQLQPLPRPQQPQPHRPRVQPEEVVALAAEPPRQPPLPEPRFSAPAVWSRFTSRMQRIRWLRACLRIPS